MKKNAVETVRFDAMRRSRCPLYLHRSPLHVGILISPRQLLARLLDFAWLFVHHRLSSVPPSPGFHSRTCSTALYIIICIASLSRVSHLTSFIYYQFFTNERISTNYQLLRNIENVRVCLFFVSCMKQDLELNREIFQIRFNSSRSIKWKKLKKIIAIFKTSEKKNYCINTCVETEVEHESRFLRSILQNLRV